MEVIDGTPLSMWMNRRRKVEEVVEVGRGSPFCTKMKIIKSTRQVSTTPTTSTFVSHINWISSGGKWR